MNKHVVDAEDGFARNGAVPAKSRSVATFNHIDNIDSNVINDEIEINPIKIFWYAVHYRFLIISFVFCGILAGLSFTWMQTPLFSAASSLDIQSDQARVIQDLELVSQSGDIRRLETARRKLLSRDIAKRVVYELELFRDREFLAPTPRFSLTNLFRRSFGFERSASLDDLSPEQSERIAINSVLNGLTAIIVRNSSIIEVRYVHPSPQRASDIANQIVASFIDQGVDAVSETSNLARQFIEQQVAETKLKLEEAERALAEYAQNNRITTTGDEASLISDNIKAINTALIETRQKRLDAEREAQLASNGSLFALDAFSDNEAIQEINRRLVELKGEYEEKLTTFRPGFPEMRRLSAQIEELERQIQLEANAVSQSIAIQASQAGQQEAQLRSELARLETEQARFQEINIDYTILKRSVDSLGSQYDSLIGKLNEAGVGQNLRSTSVSVVDEAIVPGAPFSPSLARLVALCTIISIVASAATIFILELLNNTFAVPDQIESELKIPVLGIIPWVDENDLASELADEKSAISEAYRTLRTSLQFSGAEDNLKVIVVTSASPSEGKSTCSHRLAYDYAAIGKNVLLIDADLRKPRMHRILGLENGIGLSNLLTNVVRSKDVSSLFYKDPDTSVTVLRAGTLPPNPADLLMSPRMSMALTYFRKNYDIIIIDSAPVMGLADAPILARQADATVMVVSSKSVSKSEAKKALSRLRSSGAHVVGSVMTKFRIDRVDYNYAYKYMNYNYYSYGEPTKSLTSSTASRKGKHANAFVARFADMYERLWSGFERPR